jgi:chromosome segregation ATPase
MTDLFTNPQSEPARTLADLNARRRDLTAQQRDELTRLDAARAEHTRLATDLEDREARALALGHETPNAKADRAKLGKLERQIDEHTETTSRLARAITALNEEIKRTTITHSDELLDEAVAVHDQARDRITELVAELHAQQAELRIAYIAAQRILAAAGRNHVRLRDTPSLETLVREGEAPALFHPHDLATAA